VLLVDDEALSRLRLRTLVDDCVDPPGVVVGDGGHGSRRRCTG